MIDDDELAQAVLEGLAGMRMCPICGTAMKRMPLTRDAAGRPVDGWACWEGHDDLYMLDDGTQLVPAAPSRPYPVMFLK